MDAHIEAALQLQALLRIGAKEEVLWKHMITHSGRIRDTVYYSLLDSEWPTVKFALETKLERRISGRRSSLAHE